MQKILVAVLMTAGLYSCKNAEIDHPDFDYTTGYFPYQYPVRTLVLGDDIYDNSNDNAHKFVISVTMGGVYENTKDRSFSFRVDETLCNEAAFNTAGDEILPLPSSYYNLSSAGTIVIPGGKVNGGVEVQLTDAFFSDPKAISLGYVVPLVLTGSNDVDSILVGNSALPAPDRRIAGNWVAAPKDFTMFAIKYINEYHGNYFHSGASYVIDSAGARVDERIYKKEYVENNDVRLLTTTERHQVKLSSFLQSSIMTGPINMLITFDGDQCSVASADTNYVISGTGQFKKEAFNWGNKKRNGITLDYTVTKGNTTYHAKDELIVRDRGVVMQVYAPVISTE